MSIPLALRVTEAEARIYRKTWHGSVFSSFLTPVLYLLAMGVGLGSLVDANIPEGLDGVSYLTFLAPGLLVASAMQTGATESSWKLMGGIESQGTWKARLASPIRPLDLMIGYMIWSAIRVFMVSAIFAVILIVFRIAPVLQSFATIVPAMFVGVGMAAVTAAVTVRLKGYAGIPMFFRFVVIPMFLFSGVFFPITNLPGWLQPVAVATPIYHGVEIARSIVVGTTPAVAWWISFLYMGSWIVAGTYLSIDPLRKRLTP
ncbi:MAG: ABC transporter permease [Actinomycetia bacterium]|nr:ABC transporter permease [Actinomycetes bacterium]